MFVLFSLSAALLPSGTDNQAELAGQYLGAPSRHPAPAEGSVRQHQADSGRGTLPCFVASLLRGDFQGEFPSLRLGGNSWQENRMGSLELKLEGFA